MCAATVTASAQKNDDDKPSAAVPKWAEGVRRLLDKADYAAALSALAKLAPSREKEAVFHLLRAEAWGGKGDTADNEKEEVRCLQQAHISLLQAKKLSPRAAHRDIDAALKEVEDALRDLNASPGNSTSSPSPQPAATPKPAATSSASSEAGPWKVGDKVEAYRDATWMKATIVELGSGGYKGYYKVLFDGLSDTKGQFVLPSWIRARKGEDAAAPPAASPSPTAGPDAGPWKVGDKVEAYISGTAYKGTILEIGTGAYTGYYKVLSDGFSMGQFVKASNIVARKGEAAATQPAADAGPWKVGDKVEAAVGPTYFKATIAGIGTGENLGYYKCHFDDTSEAFVKASDIRAIKGAQPSPSPSGPRLGKYEVRGLTRSGFLELQAGGKYKFYNAGDRLIGTGEYSFDANAKTVKWDSGPFKDYGWGGAFSIDRGGKTHRIELKRGTIAHNSVD